MIDSAGILLFRHVSDVGLEVWIAHMGGPFWARKDAAAWSIPKGEYGPDEAPLAVALREFEEEIGVPAPDLPYTRLGGFRQGSGKTVTVFTAAHDGDLEWVGSNTFDLEWPPRSGRTRAFPEIDAARWFPLDEARPRLVAGQRPMLTALVEHLR